MVAGCGSTPDAWWLLKHGAKSVVGIDISANQLRRARERMEKAGLTAEFIQRDLDALSKNQFKRASFDLIIANYAFQYVHNLPKLFRILSQFLKPEEKFVFSFDHPVSVSVEEKIPRGKTNLHVDYLHEKSYTGHSTTSMRHQTGPCERIHISER